MKSIFDNLNIKIKIRGFNENPIAIVTLNLNNEAEVRFATIMWKKDRKGIFFRIPTLINFNRWNSFIVLDLKQFNKIRKAIMDKFLNVAEHTISPKEVEKIRLILKKQEDYEKKRTNWTKSLD